MRSTIVAYLLTAVVFFGMDLVWLSTMVGFFYKPRIGDLLLDPPKLGVAAVFYLIYVVGVVVFAVLPAVKDGDWTRAAWSGALLGFVAYGTYDMTNLATLRGFSASVAAIDMVWGTVATATAATLAAIGTSRWG
jgi:uncharacterized membrane protein